MPLEATPCEQAVVELAMTGREVPTVELLLGEITDTVANAGNAQTKENITQTTALVFIETGPRRPIRRISGRVPGVIA